MQRATRWRSVLLAATVVGASTAAVAGCVSTVAGVPRVGSDRAPLSWGPDLAAAQLADVLLDAAAVNQFMGTNTMTELRTYDQMPGDDGSYSDAACAGAVFNTVEAAYKGSGYVPPRVRNSAMPAANTTSTRASSRSAAAATPASFLPHRKVRGAAAWPNM